MSFTNPFGIYPVITVYWSAMIERVLNWIKTHSPSGVLNWENGQAYPEVTGYLIPTLLKYGEDKLARQYADWLLSIQNADGSFNDINGLARTFDTAAIMEGLYAIGETEAADRAKKWLQGLYMDCGALPIIEGDDHTHIYTARASGLINSRYGRSYWSFEGDWDERWGENQRTHYIAYGLEGLALLGVDITDALIASQNALQAFLMPYRVTRWQYSGGTDISATCQMAILYKQFGLEYQGMIEAVEKLIMPSGGLPLSKDSLVCASWTAKFYLDVKHE
jgi:hypothetical protein